MKLRHIRSQGYGYRGTKWYLSLGLLLLLIEFFDELVGGAHEAAWPLIRNDLNLSYAQIGLLLSLPGLVDDLIRLPMGILGDLWNRRRLIVIGGLCFALELLFVGIAPSFWALLFTFVIFAPANGVFVNLAQATLMDMSLGDTIEEAKETAPKQISKKISEMAMARWTLAGSVGVVSGPLILGVAVWSGIGWRGLFLILAGLLGLTTLLVARQSFPTPVSSIDAKDFRSGLALAWQALQRKTVQRWLILLGFSDFMLDILLSFLALYFVDVVEVTPAWAGTAVAVWTGVGLLGDALLLPLLRRIRGLVYLRYSAALMIGLYSAFLLIPFWSIKLLLVGVMGLLNAGWYAILKAQLYEAMPGQSGAVMTVNAFAGFFFGFVPALLGWVAGSVGLESMMWLLLAGPFVLLIGLPRQGAG